MIQERGKPTAKALQDFFAAGFTPAQVFEVVLGLSTMANYSGHVTQRGTWRPTRSCVRNTDSARRSSAAITRAATGILFTVTSLVSGARASNIAPTAR